MNIWDERFRSGRHPWDIGRASPLVMRLIDDWFQPPARVLVVGCGQGWEVEALLERGFEVTGFDIAPAALALIERRLGARAGLSLVEGDILAPPADLRGCFDLAVEHTCICSLSPSSWPEYVSSVAAALVSGGHFVGAFFYFQSHEEDGPPHGTEPAAVRAQFRRRFEIRLLNVAPEPFPPQEMPLPPQVNRVPQLEAVFRKRPD